jgi:mRNA interferase MazF
MVMHRGEIWWASLGDPEGAGPGYRRPVLIVQSDEFNRSRIGTVIVAALTGNVLIKARYAGLAKDSVVNVSQVITVDKQCLTEKVKKLEASFMAEVDNGIRLVLAI